jgi:hypothetical protein
MAKATDAIPSARRSDRLAILERKRALEADSKKSIILWSSIAAATAGIVAVAAIFTWKARKMSSEQFGTHIRDVQDVLSDCETKIHEIQGRIADILPSVSQTTTS